jgi:hypothetical protein
MQTMTVAIRVTIGVIGGIVAAVCGVVSAVLCLKIVDQVNPHLTSEQRFSPVGWYFGKTLRVFREYHRLFPSGSDVRRICLLGTVGVIGLLAAAIAIGFGVGQLLWLGLGGVLVMWLPYWLASRQ